MTYLIRQVLWIGIASSNYSVSGNVGLRFVVIIMPYNYKQI